jgi:hypothetical protein
MSIEAEGVVSTAGSPEDDVQRLQTGQVDMMRLLGLSGWLWRRMGQEKVNSSVVCAEMNIY